jgi:hypothetical protein
MQSLRKNADFFLRFHAIIETQRVQVFTINDSHQQLIDRIYSMHVDGMSNTEISRVLNNSGVVSIRGNRFYSNLVFGIIRKFKLRLQRLTSKDVIVIV